MPRTDIVTEETHGVSPDLIDQAGDIVAAYVSNNHVAPADLPAVIASVHAALTRLGSSQPAVSVDETVERPSAAEIRRSVGQDGIVSFIDGRTYKTLKRHLTAHGLTPTAYRQRYGLPTDYPMVAPSYSERRSSLAKAIGLGVPGAQAERDPSTAKGRRKAA